MSVRYIRNSRWLAVILLAAFILTGCAKEKTEGESCRLKLSVVADSSETFTFIAPEELGDSYQNGIDYYGISQASIECGGKTQELVSAIQNGDITPEEIVAYARIDARNGLCQMGFSSDMGYACYSYSYADYTVLSVNDVFEAPDGEQYAIERLIIGTPELVERTSLGWPVIEENGEYRNLGREDWGLTFEISQVTPDKLVLTCVQSGGQQAGQLEIADYVLLRQDDNWSQCDRLDGDTPFELVPLEMEGSTTITIDWTGRYAALPAGDYVLNLYLKETYEDTHEFMRNYTDAQSYFIPFTLVD